MATKQYNSRIQWKKDTASNWTSNNPVLLNGEIAIVVTNANETRFKIGDGTSSFTALPYQDEAVRALITAVQDEVDTKMTQAEGDGRYLKLTGGTLTGNLTGRYLTGTWLQSTAVTGFNSNNYRGICIFDNSGWVYFRTKEEILEDIGASAKSSAAFNSEYHGTLPTSGWVSSNGQYYYQVTISDMVSSSVPLVIPQWTSNKANEKSAWSTLTDMESFNGYIRFYAPSPIATTVPYTLLYTNYDDSVITLVNRKEGTEVTGTFTPA